MNLLVSQVSFVYIALTVYYSISLVFHNIIQGSVQGNSFWSNLCRHLFSVKETSPTTRPNRLPLH